MLGLVGGGFDGGAESAQGVVIEWWRWWWPVPVAASGELVDGCLVVADPGDAARLVGGGLVGHGAA